MSGPALSIEELVKTFDVGFIGALPGMGGLAERLQIRGIAQRVRAVRGISLEVERGEIFGFLGPNGAGKTTTLKMLMGLIHPTSGTGHILGEPLGSKTARARLGFLPEHPYFYEYLKPIEFLEFYGRLFQMSAQARRQRAEALVARVGLEYAVNRPLRKFSKGMIQRMGVAQALVNDPDLVVLDEPMSGLDPMGRKDVRDIILELKAQGKTVFFSSHILQDVEMICDRVAIVVQGRVRALGPLDSLVTSADHSVEVVVAGLDDDAVGRLATTDITAARLAEKVRFTLPRPGEVDAFVRAALDAGGALVSVVPHRPSLEDVFVATAAKEDAARNEGDA